MVKVRGSRVLDVRRTTQSACTGAQTKYEDGKDEVCAPCALCFQGVARQRQAIVNGLRDSILNFSSDVTDVNSKDVIEMMMVTQYFDMLRDIGGHGRRARTRRHPPACRLREVQHSPCLCKHHKLQACLDSTTVS